MNLKRRLRAIERAITPSDGERPACGITSLEAIKIQIDPDGTDEPKEPAVCPECGWRRVITLTIDDPRDARP